MKPLGVGVIARCTSHDVVLVHTTKVEVVLW